MGFNEDLLLPGLKLRPIQRKLAVVRGEVYVVRTESGGPQTEN